ncbi:MAG: hypothetical protein JST54_08890 [Deltaproteobacteria bacterium]|nr:hypothetical protein [Deltaproteobacteria bacterium]
MSMRVSPSMIVAALTLSACFQAPVQDPLTSTTTTTGGTDGSAASSTSGSASTGTSGTNLSTGTIGTSTATSTSATSSTSSTGSTSSATTFSATASAGSTAAASSSSGTTGSTGMSTTTGSTADLTCLGQELIPTPVAGVANLTLNFKDAIAGSRIVGATVDLCAVGVSSCDATTRDTTGTTDAQGTVSLPVVTMGQAYFGYVHLTGSSAALDTFAYLPPIAADVTQDVSTVSATDVNLLGVFMTGRTIDVATHGIVDGIVVDCSANAITGATVTTSSTDSSTDVSYFSGGFPSPSTTTTDASGNFFAINVPAEPNLDVTYFSDSSQATPVAKFNVQVAAGALTTILGGPNQ